MSPPTIPLTSIRITDRACMASHTHHTFSLNNHWIPPPDGCVLPHAHMRRSIFGHKPLTSIPSHPPALSSLCDSLRTASCSAHSFHSTQSDRSFPSHNLLVRVEAREGGSRRCDQQNADITPHRGDGNCRRSPGLAGGALKALPHKGLPSCESTPSTPG